MIREAISALFVTGKYESIEAAVKVSFDAIDNRKAAAKLDEFVRFSNEG